MRRLGLRLSLVFVAAAAAVTSASAAPARPFETGLLADVNAFRARHHLPALRLSTPLTLAARAHSMQMAKDGYFGHESADGSAFWRRIQSFYRASRYWSVGENLVWSSSAVDAAGVLKLWLASSDHLQNLMNPLWREIGVSAVRVAHAPGVFRRLDVTIVTADFGVRRGA